MRVEKRQINEEMERGFDIWGKRRKENVDLAAEKEKIRTAGERGRKERKRSKRGSRRVWQGN